MCRGWPGVHLLGNGNHKKPAGLSPEPAGYPTCLYCRPPCTQPRKQPRTDGTRGKAVYSRNPHFFHRQSFQKNGVLVDFFQNFVGFMVFFGYVVVDIRKAIPRHYC